MVWNQRLLYAFLSWNDAACWIGRKKEQQQWRFHTVINTPPLNHTNVSVELLVAIYFSYENESRTQPTNQQKFHSLNLTNIINAFAHFIRGRKREQKCSTTILMNKANLTREVILPILFYHWNPPGTQQSSHLCEGATFLRMHSESSRILL